jgi:cohesin complex subunit SA-1/2
MDSPTSNASSPAPAERRRSGRVTKKPQHLGDQLGVPAKRKRTADEDLDGEDVEMQDDEEDEDDESDEEDPEDEDAGARRRRPRKSTSGNSRAIKKPKQNGEGVNLAIRSASATKSSKPRGKRAVRFSAVQAADGLYGTYCASAKVFIMLIWSS